MFSFAGTGRIRSRFVAWGYWFWTKSSDVEVLCYSLKLMCHMNCEASSTIESVGFYSLTLKGGVKVLQCEKYLSIHSAVKFHTQADRGGFFCPQWSFLSSRKERCVVWALQNYCSTVVRVLCVLWIVWFSLLQTAITLLTMHRIFLNPAPHFPGVIFRSVQVEDTPSLSSVAWEIEVLSAKALTFKQHSLTFW